MDFASLSSRFAKARQNLLDIAFIGFMAVLAVYYHSYISEMAFPVWDGAIYLQNAHSWLTGEPLEAPYRPQLVSLVIAGIWSITGEDWTAVKYLQSVFTLGSGVILYLTLRSHKGSAFALGVTSLTMLNPYVFFWSTQILTEGVALFFLVLTLYFLKSRHPYSGLFAGVAMALTFASRYPIFIQAAVLFLVEAITRRNAKFLGHTIVTLIPVALLFVTIVYLKADEFSVAISKDTRLTPSLSQFYAEGFIRIFGFASILVPLAFLFGRTYKDQFMFLSHGLQSDFCFGAPFPEISKIGS
jgi:4-amino-4-deoxy-L-arabinose transferase-like glycosyltransferase